MTNNWRTYECSAKFCSYVTTGMVFQIALTCRGYFPQWGGMGNFAGVSVFSLVTNSSLKLKMNICILELSILFPQSLLFFYYIQEHDFDIFEKNGYVLLFYITLDISLISSMIPYHIWNIIYFFPKIEKATFTNQFHLLIFFRLKTKLFLSKTKNAKRG